ncbi:MAG: hypothetical protein K8T89_01405 [Planctomycetes bacterium]|nr:hypothetical protein [Planctomycetota bacterium]
MLREIEYSYGKTSSLRIFVTGSGVAAFVPLIGARFVHEINAVTLAVESLHLDVQTVIELGGQDAKMIHFRTDPTIRNEEQTRCMFYSMG